MSSTLNPDDLLVVHRPSENKTFKFTWQDLLDNLDTTTGVVQADASGNVFIDGNLYITGDLYHDDTVLIEDPDSKVTSQNGGNVTISGDVYVRLTGGYDIYSYTSPDPATWNPTGNIHTDANGNLAVTGNLIVSGSINTRHPNVRLGV